MEIYEPKSKSLPTVGFCVFNLSKRDKRVAREAFIRRYGRKDWEAFTEQRIKTGVMQVFHNSPDEKSIFYVNTIARRVDKRALRREEKECNAPTNADQ